MKLIAHPIAFSLGIVRTDPLAVDTFLAAISNQQFNDLHDEDSEKSNGLEGTTKTCATSPTHPLRTLMRIVVQRFRSSTIQDMNNALRMFIRNLIGVHTNY